MTNNKLLFFDPSNGNVAGAQKVSGIVLRELKAAEVYDIKVLSSGLGDVYQRCYKQYFHSIMWFKFLCEKAIGRAGQSRLAFLILPFCVLTSNFQVACEVLFGRRKLFYTIDPRGIILGGIGARLVGAKVIWHLHSDMKGRSFQLWLYSRLADVVVVPSEYVAKNLKDSFKDVRVVYNGFDFSVNQCCSLKPSKVLNLLYVGSIVPHKGLHKAILAASKVQERDVVLTVLGDVPVGIGREYMEYLNKIPIPSSLQLNFVGWVDDVVTYISGSNYLLFPSVHEEVIDFGLGELVIRSSEALPTVLIEALSCGTAVIASNVAGVDEIVRDGVDGYIVDDFDVEKVGDLLSRSAEERLSVVDRARVRKKFSKFGMIENMRIIIDELLK